ncbi:MAG: hypothetical protein ACKO26_10350 [Planctomycetota bacterium]
MITKVVHVDQRHSNLTACDVHRANREGMAVGQANMAFRHEAMKD